VWETGRTRQGNRQKRWDGLQKKKGKNGEGKGLGKNEEAKEDRRRGPTKLKMHGRGGGGGGVEPRGGQLVSADSNNKRVKWERKNNYTRKREGSGA